MKSYSIIHVNPNKIALISAALTLIISGLLSVELAIRIFLSDDPILVTDNDSIIPLTIIGNWSILVIPIINALASFFIFYIITFITNALLKLFNGIDIQINEKDIK